MTKMIKMRRTNGPKCTDLAQMFIRNAFMHTYSPKDHPNRISQKCTFAKLNSSRQRTTEKKSKFGFGHAICIHPPYHSAQKNRGVTVLVCADRFSSDGPILRELAAEPPLPLPVGDLGAPLAAKCCRQFT